jgi:hypothetical protein
MRFFLGYEPTMHRHKSDGESKNLNRLQQVLDLHDIVGPRV